MTVDGVLLGAFTMVLGVVLGLLIAHYYEVRIEDTKQRLGEVMVQQQNRIDALEQYIKDHSDTETSAEDLWGHG